MIKELFFGFSIPFRAIRLILSDRRLALLCCVPVILSIALWILIWNFAFIPILGAVSDVTTNFLIGLFNQSETSMLYGVTRFFIWLMVGVLMLLLSAVCFAISTNLISLPINDFIAQRAENLIALGQNNSSDSGWRDALPLLIIDLKKSIFSAICILLCLCLAWVPILNIFAAVVAWFFMTFQYVSYAQTRRFIGLRAGLSELLKVLPGALTFGLITTLAFSIPLMIIIAHPVALVGGALLYREIERKSQNPLKVD